MGVHFNEARYPLVEIHFDTPIADADVAAFCDKMRELVARKKPYASVFNTEGALHLAPAQRRQMVAISKELEAESALYVVVACIAIDNALARGVITAINWFSPPPFEQRFFSSLVEARAYAAERLQAKGLTVPP
jgi:hypothetical protein